MRTPEGVEKDDIKKFLNDLPGCWYFFPFMMGYGKNGVSDVVACKQITITPEMVGQTIGVFVAIEVKREGKEPTTIQNRRMAEIGLAGGATFWGTASKVILEFKARFGLSPYV